MPRGGRSHFAFEQFRGDRVLALDTIHLPAWCFRHGIETTVAEAIEPHCRDRVEPADDPLSQATTQREQASQVETHRPHHV